MPALTALIYNYTDGSKNYHRIKATVYDPWPRGARRPSTVRVRLSKPIVCPSIPASQDEYTYAGTCRWQFEGQQQPEQPIGYENSKQAPAGWFFWSGNYYSWYQVPEPITTNTQWAMKRAAELWKTIDLEREHSTAKRMKQQATMRGGA